MGVLYKLFSSVFRKEMEEEFTKEKKESFNMGIYRGREDFYKEDAAERNKILNFEVERIAKSGPVIVLANEWQNPVIAKVVDRTKSPWDKNKLVPILKDYLTGEVFEEYRTLIPFSMKTLEAVGKLDPDDIVALFYEGRNSNKDVYKKKENIMTSDTRKYTGLDDWLDKMMMANFFSDYPEFKDTNLYRKKSQLKGWSDDVENSSDLVQEELNSSTKKPGM